MKADRKVKRAGYFFVTAVLFLFLQFPAGMNKLIVLFSFYIWGNVSLFSGGELHILIRKGGNFRAEIPNLMLF